MFFRTTLIIQVAHGNVLPGQTRVKEVEVDMKILDLKPEDFPLAIRLHVPGNTKQYVLLKTKQEKLLLNKSQENLPSTK
jgi:hypothetical protein